MFQSLPRLANCIQLKMDKHKKKCLAKDMTTFIPLPTVISSQCHQTTTKYPTIHMCTYTSKPWIYYNKTSRANSYNKTSRTNSFNKTNRTNSYLFLSKNFLLFSNGSSLSDEWRRLLSIFPLTLLELLVLSSSPSPCNYKRKCICNVKFL